jgi:tetratricopeptide (TPR) repeat protein
MLLQMRRDFAGARLHLDRAVTLSPGDVETLGYTGLEYAYAGEPERGIGQAEQAIRLNPYFPPVSAEQVGKACFVGRRYEEALFWLRQTPDRITTNRGWLAAAAAYAGRPEEAAMHARLMRATLQQRLGDEELRAVVARSGGSGYRPGSSMQPTWSTTSAVWPWLASNRDFGGGLCGTAPERIEPFCLHENQSAGC